MFKIHTGPMKAGKTTALITDYLTHTGGKNLRGKIFIHSIDTKHESTMIHTHSNQKLPAVKVNTSGEILKYIDEYDVFAIDEIQFFIICGDKDDGSEMERVIKILLGKGKTIIGTLLKSDYRWTSFPGSSKIYPLGKIKDHTAFCEKCSKTAITTHLKGHNKDSKENEIVIEPDPKFFETLCTECYMSHYV